MKKNILISLILTIFLISFASSIDVELKDSFKKGENFVVKISGIFTKPLLKENVHFYRGHLSTSMGVFDLERIEGDYYFYFQIPEEKIPDNYTIVLEDVEYMSGSSVSTEDVAKSFIILDELAPFSLTPALIISDGDYELEIQNLLSNSINIDLTKKERTVEYIESSGEPIDAGGFLDALFGVFSKNVTENVTPEGNEEIPIEIIVEDIPYITLKSGETKKITFSPSVKKGFEMLNLYYENEAYGTLVYNPVNREIVKDPVVVENSSDSNITTIEVNESVNNTAAANDTVINVTTSVTQDEIDSCESINTSICIPEVEKCDGSLEYSGSVKCCVGECVKVEKKSNGKLIGWILIIAIALFVIWFIKKKYRGAGPGKIDLLKIGRK